MNRIKRIISAAAAICLAISLAGCDAVDIIKEKLPLEETQDGGTIVENNDTAEISNSISVGILDFDTFNPLLTESESVKECMQFVYEPLFDINEIMQPYPILAESYTVSADGRTIDINLKNNILWQDGSSFTAYDVAYTFKQILAGKTTYTSSLEDVEDYSATGDYSISIELKRAVPSFVSLLTFPIVQYQTDMDLDANYIPVGTGAFKYEAQLSTGKLSFAAFENYHNGRANIDNLYVYTAPDLRKYESMFEASEIDLITDNTVDLLEYTPRGSAKNNEYITNKMTFVGYNLQSKILSGADTRKGLAKLIDKDGIVNSTIYSKGVASDLPINPSSLYYYDTNTKFKSDELSALQFLGNDGWGVNLDGQYVRTVDGERQTLTLEILTNADSAEKVSIAEKIAGDFNYFGIPTEVNALPYEEYMAKVDAKDYDLMIGEVEIGANLDLSPLVSSSGNYFSYSSADLDTLTEQMGMTRDEEELKALFVQYGDIILNDMPFSVLFYRKGDVLSGSKIKTEIVPTVGQVYRNVETWSVTQ
ncbi:MAG: ABC transporter substrate-binding protein [Firmicutes bacterium]|nr:ABC transporter substrate-binding protein [Bacillota bacterium]